jgi:hypothetical protein
VSRLPPPLPDRPAARLRCALFCGPGSITATRLAIDLYARGGARLDLTVVTPASCAASFGGEATVLADEAVPGHAEIVAWLAAERARITRRGRSTGWYLQQYLKLAVAWHAPASVFVHDGDTVFAPAMLHELAERPAVMTTREDPSAYNRAAAHLGLPSHARSFVANGGLFDGETLRTLGADPVTWFTGAMERAVLAPDDGADFSEYQLMGALLATRWPLRPLRLFRRFDLIASAEGGRQCAERALRRYDAIAFETAHRASWSKRVLGRFAYAANVSW